MKTTIEIKSVEELLVEGYVHVEGYENLYMINKEGKVWNVTWNREIKVTKGQRYMRVKLRKDGKRKTVDLHRILAIAFVENPHNKPFVNHIDENGFNNELSNLEFVTHQENLNHGTAQARRADKIKKKVEQYSLEGELLTTFDSIKDAGETTNIHRTSITKVCLGARKSAGGYIWKYSA